MERRLSFKRPGGGDREPAAIRGRSSIRARRKEPFAGEVDQSGESARGSPFGKSRFIGTSLITIRRDVSS